MTRQHARPMAAERRRQSLRWYAGLAVEIALLLTLIVAVVLTAGLSGPMPR